MLLLGREPAHRAEAREDQRVHAGLGAAGEHRVGIASPDDLRPFSDRVRAGRDLVPGELLEFEGWSHRATVEEVPNPGEIAFAANRFYQRPDEASVPLFQLTYDDREGRFPWEDGYANAVWIQPRPGSFTAW